MAPEGFCCDAGEVVSYSVITPSHCRYTLIEEVYHNTAQLH